VWECWCRANFNGVRRRYQLQLTISCRFYDDLSLGSDVGEVSKAEVGSGTGARAIALYREPAGIFGLQHRFCEAEVPLRRSVNTSALADSCRREASIS